MAVEVITGETTVVEVVIPGPQGPAGADGADGVSAFTPVSHVRKVFVGKHGDNSNDGTSVERAVLSIEAAIDIANALAENDEWVTIEIVDGGYYVRSGATILDDHVSIEGPMATVETRLVLRDSCRVKLLRLVGDGSGFPMINKNSGSNRTWVEINEIDGTDESGKTLVRNDAGGGILDVACYRIWVGANCVGAGDNTGEGAGEVHFSAWSDLYLAGNGAIGLTGNANSTRIIAFVGHIRETGSPTGTIGVQADQDDQEIKLITTQIIADTAINVTAAANVNIHSTEIIGTVINTGNGLKLSAAEINGNPGPFGISPNGTVYRIAVSDAGVLSAVTI